MLINQLEITSADVKFFQDTGFIPLRGLLTQTAIDGLREITKASQLEAPSNSSYGDFARMGYNLKNTTLEDIYSSPELANILSTITGRDLSFTQSMGFELEPEKKGFNWHVGIQAFHYIMPKDFGCSIWIPLDPIKVKEQHGGMAYVPRNIYSAYEYFSLIYQLVQQEDMADALTSQEFHNSQYASKLEAIILEANKVEDYFEIGDVFLFDKFVWHRSCPLGEGELSSRMAYVMRFVDRQARYSKGFLEGLANSRKSFGKPLQTLYGYKFSNLNDGDPLGNNL